MIEGIALYFFQRRTRKVSNARSLRGGGGELGFLKT
jgi:hypothetical protein